MKQDQTCLASGKPGLAALDAEGAHKTSLIAQPKTRASKIAQHTHGRPSVCVQTIQKRLMEPLVSTPILWISPKACLWFCIFAQVLCPGTRSMAIATATSQRRRPPYSITLQRDVLNCTLWCSALNLQVSTAGAAASAQLPAPLNQVRASRGCYEIVSQCDCRVQRWSARLDAVTAAGCKAG